MKKLLKILVLGFIILVILGAISKNKRANELSSGSGGAGEETSQNTEKGDSENDSSGVNDTGGSPSTRPTEPRVLQNLQKINVQGEAIKTGLADASLEYGDGTTGYMAYSWVNFASTDKRYVETHIAKSNDRGATWQYVFTANTSNDAVGEGKFLGVWRNETPSLVYDPSDSADKRWKLYYQRYLAPTARSHAYTLNIIAYQYAASPEGPWSEAVCILGNLPGCHQKLGDINPGLSGMIFFNELGTLSYNGKLYMSMDVSPSDTGVGSAKDLENRRMILLESNNHGQSWSYSGKLTDFKDATDYGYVTFTASSLTTHDGKPYLMISPSGSIKGKNKAHDGSYIIAFENISKAQLLRDSENKLLFTKILKPPGARGGQSDYDQKNTGGGIVFSQLISTDSSQPFQIFNTFEDLVD